MPTAPSMSQKEELVKLLWKMIFNNMFFVSFFISVGLNYFVKTLKVFILIGTNRNSNINENTIYNPFNVTAINCM